jgi:hypothetical protein
MEKSSPSSFRTDLAEYLLDLLDFVEEKIEEAKNDPASRAGALSEAMGALPIMKDRLYHEDQEVLTQLLLTGFFDEDLTRLAVVPEDELVKRIDDLGQRHAVIRGIFDSRTPSP